MTAPIHPDLYTSTQAEVCSDHYRLVIGADHAMQSRISSLRASVFCRELGWVGTPSQQHELDYFDNHSVDLTVESADGELVGYLRMHPSSAPWMADTVFRDITRDISPKRTQNSCEASRLAIAPHYRKRKFQDGQTAAGLIYQLMYAYCMFNNYNCIYMIISEHVSISLKKYGIPCLLHTSKARGRDRKNHPIFATINWNDFHSSDSSLTRLWRPIFTATYANLRYNDKQELSNFVEI